MIDYNYKTPERPIPQGYVIIAEQFSFHCKDNSTDRDDDKNLFVIKKPADQEAVCSVSPISENYVVIGKDFSNNCPNSQNSSKHNRRIIKKVK